MPAQSSLSARTHTHGRTTLTHGTTTRHTASVVHGTGAVTTTHGTATHGAGADGTVHITMADGTTHGTTDDGMTHGTMAAGTIHGITEDTMEDTTAVITDGTLIGDTTITTITLQCRSTTRSAGMETADRPVQTECSQADFLPEAV